MGSGVQKWAGRVGRWRDAVTLTGIGLRTLKRYAAAKAFKVTRLSSRLTLVDLESLMAWATSNKQGVR
jgi:hypothetical protein